MAAEWVSAFAEVITAVAAITGVAVAYWQLSEIAGQARVQGDRERQWQTIAACQRYINDPVLMEAKRRIWLARDNGTQDFIGDPQSVRQDAIILVNFLDNIAIGVRQKVYIKDIVKDNLAVVMTDAVSRFIEGGWGNFRINKDHLRDLVALVQEFRDQRPDHTAVP